MLFKTSMHHIHLCCQDVDAAARWFVDVLGGELMGPANFYGGATGLLVMLGGANLYIRGTRPGEVLADNGGAERYGFDHIGLRVDDIDALAAHLQAKHVQFEVPVHQHRPGNRVAFVKGPDNIRIELSEVRVQH